MDKEKRKIVKNIMKIFEEKGIDTEDMEEMAEIKETKTDKKLHQYEKITDLKDMLNQSSEKFKDNPAFKFKTDVAGEFRVTTYGELLEQVNALGTQLISMGLKNKRIAVIGENRYEWALAYLAVACGTGVVVPLDRSLPANEIESLIIRSRSSSNILHR